MVRKEVREVWITSDNKEFRTQELAEYHEQKTELSIEIDGLTDDWEDNSSDRIAEYLLKTYKITRITVQLSQPENRITSKSGYYPS